MPDHGPFGGCQQTFLLNGENAGGSKADVIDPQGFLINTQKQRRLVLYRNCERINAVRRYPIRVGKAVDGRQYGGGGRDLIIGASNCHSLLRSSGNSIAGEVLGCGKAPGPAHQCADIETIGIRALHLSDHLLASTHSFKLGANNPAVCVVRACAACCVHRQSQQLPFG